MTLLRNTIGTWLCLSIAFLPFPYAFIPRFGEMTSSIWLQITSPLTYIFGFKNATLHTHSDSIHSWILSVILLLIGFVIAFILKRFDKEENALTIIRTSLRFFLILFLVKYGMDKLLMNQFVQAEPNVLHSKLGELSKDVLFWTSTGTSNLFNYTLGAIQFLVATFLLFPRTRFFGYLLSTFVFSYILLINLSFDISVKLLSSLLLISSLYLLSFHTGRIKALFASSSNQFTFQNDVRSPRVFSLLFITLILLETVFSSIAILNSKSIAKTLVGTYKIDETIAGLKYSNLFIRSDGFIVIDSSEDSEFYGVSIEENEITPLDEKQLPFRILRKYNSLQISWYTDSTDIIKSLERLPTPKEVYKADFHLFLENYE